MFSRIRRYYSRNLSVGDRLGEAIYAVWMVVVSVGLINSEADITPDRILEVVAIALGVNLVWGVIDGITVMFTNVMDRARLDELVFDIRSRPEDSSVRRRMLDHFDDTAVGYLGEEDREKVVALIAAGAPGRDPRREHARAGREDWLYALAIVCIDVGLAIPVLVPLLVIGDVETAVFVSRLVATYMFAALGALYAHNLRRRPWVAALLLGALGHTLFVSAFAAGW